MRTLLVVAAAAASLFMAQCVASWTFQYDKCKDCVDFTQSNTGCPCWFDITMNCACCKNDGVQCGYPMHNYCWPKTKFIKRGRDYSKLGMGCFDKKGNGTRNSGIGVASPMNTISATGHPCPWNTTDTSCSFCAVGNWICPEEFNVDGSGGKTSLSGYYRGKGPYNKCVSERTAQQLYKAGRHLQVCKPTDCKIWPESCSVDATCNEVEYLPGKKTHLCVCRSGFIGNGIKCVDKDSGTIRDPTTGVPVGFDLKVTTELFLGPNKSNVTELSESQFSAMTGFLSSGKDQETVEGSQCQLVGVGAQSRVLPYQLRNKFN